MCVSVRYFTTLLGAVGGVNFFRLVQWNHCRRRGCNLKIAGQASNEWKRCGKRTFSMFVSCVNLREVTVPSLLHTEMMFRSIFHASSGAETCLLYIINRCHNFTGTKPHVSQMQFDCSVSRSLEGHILRTESRQHSCCESTLTKYIVLINLTVD